MSGRIALEEGDIGLAEVDAIVNAANTELVLAEGVAAAIAERGGDTIGAECRALAPVDLGSASATTAGDLAAKAVIHAAVLEPGGRATETSIVAALAAALELAEENGWRTIAVPALGAGDGGIATQRAAERLLEAAQAHLDAKGSELEEIRFVLFGEPTYRIFEMCHDAAKVAAQMAKLKRR